MKKRLVLLILLSTLLIGAQVRVTPAAIVPAIVASRTSGVAPLSVFFDATGTTGLTDTGFFSDGASYMDATFAWDFDADNNDPNGKYEKASGFVAAHVFDHPGTYRVHLDVYDAAGNTASKDLTITVLPFSGTTYYVADDGSDSNDGLSMITPFLTPHHALTGSHVQPNTRILFRNGDTFTIANGIYISNRLGPIIIGGYSDPLSPSSDKPIVYITAVNTDWATINFENCSDIRIMDIAARATAESGGSPGPRYPYGIGWDNDSSHMLKYRTEEYQNGGISLSPNGQYSTVAECEFHNTTETGYTEGGEGINNGNDGNALIGNIVYDKNLVDTVHIEHVFRLQGGSRYFIAHNEFGPNNVVNYDSLTIRGDSGKVVIYKNKLYGWVQAVRPQNKNSAEEYQHHIIFDSNLIRGQGLYENDRLTSIEIVAKDIVIRNNIIYDYTFGTVVDDDSVVGYSRRIKIYNNTFINPRANETFSIIAIVEPCTNIDIKNNLMLDVSGSASSYSSFIDIWEGTTFNGESDHNMFYGSTWGANPALFDGNTLATWRANTNNDLNSSISNPNLVSTDPDNANFCKPQAGSPVINAGEFTPAALDYNGNLRGSSIDIGACEYSSVCANKAVKISETSNYYDTVSAAYSAASTGQTILMQEKSFTENLSLTDDITVTLRGGYDCNYSANPGFTTISGIVTIGGLGSVTADKLIIK